MVEGGLKGDGEGARGEGNLWLVYEMNKNTDKLKKKE